MFFFEKKMPIHVLSPVWGGLRWGFVPHSETKQERPSFFEKKEAKKLLFWRQRTDPGHSLDRGGCGEAKVFCFFSSEKKDFLRFSSALPAC